ncbi:MAG TPA: hypothetical protein VFS67_14935 [Polyangiaceae bacterium]|nr:hypothetical protein [Polyangiaceae bacterium]
MAADSSINETDAPAAGDEKPSPLREAPAGPPRPPRPTKRASGPVRIPLPSAITPGSRLNASVRPEPARSSLSSRVAPAAPSLEADDATAESKPRSAPRAEAPVPSSRPGYAPSTPRPKAPSSAPAATLEEVFDASVVPTPVPTARSSTRPPPAVVTPAVPGDPKTNIEFQLTRRSSAAPPLSFGSAEGDPSSERAPAAPLTPARDVPPLYEPEAEGAPARAAQPDQDHEQTIVGAVAQNLLELSSENEEENTRAYQAPPELVDLARRQREERRRAETVSRKRDAQRAFRDSLPPTARQLDEDDSDQSDINTATVPIPTDAAAPPVALTGPARDGSSAGPRGARSGSGAPSLSDLAREISEPRLPLSMPPVGGAGRDSSPESAASVSRYRTPWLTRGRIWVLLMGVFIVVGYALARWRGLDLFSR